MYFQNSLSFCLWRVNKKLPVKLHKMHFRGQGQSIKSENIHVKRGISIFITQVLQIDTSGLFIKVNNITVLTSNPKKLLVLSQKFSIPVRNFVTLLFEVFKKHMKHLRGKPRTKLINILSRGLRF